MVVDDEDFVYAMMLREYFSMGVTGVQAIAAMWDDVVNDRLEQTAIDWDVSIDAIIAAAARITKDIVDAAIYRTLHDGTNGKVIYDKVTEAGNLNINWVPPY